MPLLCVVSKALSIHEGGSLEQILNRSRCHKGRLLYYFPKQRRWLSHFVNLLSMFWNLSQMCAQNGVKLFSALSYYFYVSNSEEASQWLGWCLLCTMFYAMYQVHFLNSMSFERKLGSKWVFSLSRGNGRSGILILTILCFITFILQPVLGRSGIHVFLVRLAYWPWVSHWYVIIGLQSYLYIILCKQLPV